MASNKHVHLKQIRSKCYPEDISKDKGKKANFRKSSKNFKIVDRSHIKREKKNKYLTMIEREPVCKRTLGI